MKTYARFLAVLLAPVLALPLHAAPSESRDIDDIHQVIAQFQQAIKGRNSDAMLGLFVDGNAPLLASASEKTLATVRAKKADAAKILPSTSAKFAMQIGKAETSDEERFSNIKIDADDAVAAVSFDFTFLSEQKPMNEGKEAWLLVKTERGWKISSIVYSMNFPSKG
ncbi:hypothetical protein [Luteibacter sp. 329MFSha]|uniref:hypothetical protein n=1 Tax=Luteibacter sp. 329MFSha TaxID=1798239 RepID=UPI0008BF00F8|nr:hypothetical protein [Luteibacter sp. 329MFSha]SEV92491.1 hypothetical protein SAMN04515660_1016 [Luteibacter sp. 329MFSha]